MSGPGRAQRGSGPSAALFLLAHHDDEVFCAGLLTRALREGRRIKLLWATAGGLAPAARRLAEGRRVQRLLALPDQDVRLIGLPDQHAVENLSRLEREAADLLDDVDEVYVTAWEGGHPDHDAMNLVAARLRERAAGGGGADGGTAGAAQVTPEAVLGAAQGPDLVPRFFEFGLYCRGRGGLAVKTPFRPVEPRLESSALALRRALVRADSSQWPSLGVLATASRLQRTWGTEPVRELPAERNYSLPPSPQPLLYDLYTRWDYPSFRRTAGLPHA
jgi:LmbE family N-acetylglucosaminyl deacetylase